MLHLIDDLPAGVVGVTAEGTVTADDYHTVLDPAIEAALRELGAAKTWVSDS